MPSRLLRSQEGWEPYRCFAAVVSLQDFKRAADSLGLTVQTCKKNVSLLEQKAGEKLLRVSKEGMELTETGTKIISLANSMNRIARETEERANRPLSEAIRFSVNKCKVVYLLKPFLTEFAQSDSRVDLVIDSETLPEHGMQFSTDLMLSWHKPSAPAIETIVVGYDDIIGAASQDYIAKYGRPSPDTLSEHRMVVPSDNHSTSTTRAKTDFVRAKVKSILVGGDYCSNFEALKAGHGFGFGPTWFSGPNLVPLWIYEQSKLPLYLSYRQQRMKDSEFADFVFSLREFLEGYYARFSFTETPTDQKSLEQQLSRAFGYSFET